MKKQKRRLYFVASAATVTPDPPLPGRIIKPIAVRENQEEATELTG